MIECMRRCNKIYEPVRLKKYLRKPTFCRSKTCAGSVGRDFNNVHNYLQT